MAHLVAWTLDNVAGNVLASAVTAFGAYMLHRQRKRQHSELTAWLMHIAHKLEQDR